jgi:hypothetical protein
VEQFVLQQWDSCQPDPAGQHGTIQWSCDHEVQPARRGWKHTAIVGVLSSTHSHLVSREGTLQSRIHYSRYACQYLKCVQASLVGMEYGQWQRSHRDYQYNAVSTVRKRSKRRDAAGWRQLPDGRQHQHGMERRRLVRLHRGSRSLPAGRRHPALACEGWPDSSLHGSGAGADDGWLLHASPDEHLSWSELQSGASSESEPGSLVGRVGSRRRNSAPKPIRSRSVKLRSIINECWIKQGSSLVDEPCCLY